MPNLRRARLLQRRRRAPEHRARPVLRRVRLRVQRQVVPSEQGTSVRGRRGDAEVGRKQVLPDVCLRVQTRNLPATANVHRRGLQA